MHHQKPVQVVFMEGDEDYRDKQVREQLERVVGNLGTIQPLEFAERLAVHETVQIRRKGTQLVPWVPQFLKDPENLDLGVESANLDIKRVWLGETVGVLYFLTNRSSQATCYLWYVPEGAGVLSIKRAYPVETLSSVGDPQ